MVAIFKPSCGRAPSRNRLLFGGVPGLSTAGIFLANSSLLVFRLLSIVFAWSSLMLRNIVTNGTDETLRRCPRVWATGERPPPPTTVNDQYIVRYLNRQLSWYLHRFYGVTFMIWGPGLICSIMVIWAHGYDSQLSNRASAARGQLRSHHLLRHREEPDGEVVFDCA